MGTIAEGSAGGSPALGWQRGATRRAILDAARLLAARQNSTDFSLNTVAKEAGYSTTTVFAYFQTKTELFNAIIADDLAAIARQMRDGLAVAPQPVEPQLETPEPISEMAPVEAPAVESTPVEVTEAPAPRAPSTVVAFPAEAQPEERAAPRADAWLERRLRVFEKTLADVETRLTTAQVDSAKALSVAEEATKIFSARIDASEKRAAELSNDLTTRLSAAEKRLRENHGELRDRLLSISVRIDTLESAAHGAAAQAGYIAPLSDEKPQAPEELQAPKDVAVPEKPLTEAAETYLSAARRAAQTAAALAEMEKTPKRKPARNFWFNRATAVLAACVAMVFVFGALIAFALGEHTGRATPVRVISARTAHRVAELSLPVPPGRLGALAAAGNPQAQLLIGLRYLKGRGVAVNQQEAAKWIRLAAAHYPVAQYWMGQITEYGEGVTSNAGQALRWYEAAASLGNRDAMYNLGVAHAEGLGTQRDFAQSAHWFTKAAELGVTNAQFNLAVLYERGEGVTQSLTDAYKWYAIAAANGDGESKQRADAIATQIARPALIAAEKFASTFKPGALDRSANMIPGMGQTTLASAS
jgi:TPR repeat protein